MAYAKTLREQLPRLAAAMHAIVAAAEKDNGRGLNSDEQTQFHKLEADYSNLEESITLAEKSTSILAKLDSSDPAAVLEHNLEQAKDELRLTPAQKREKAKDPHARAFSSYLRNGINEMSVEDRQLMQKMFIQNAQATTPATAGGYLIPQGFSNTLTQAEKWFGGIDGVVGKFTTATGNLLMWPTTNDTGNRGSIIGQNVAVTEVPVVFGQIQFSAYIGTSGLVLIPLSLAQDSYFDLDTLVAEMLGVRLGRLKNWKCTVGTGVNEPTGIVTAALAAGLSVTFPVGSTLITNYIDLVKVETSVDPAYRDNPASAFMFSDSVLTSLKLLLDSAGRPLWMPGLTTSFQTGAQVTGYKPTILGHPYYINNDMAVEGVSNDAILFGDLSLFKVREVAGGVTVMRLVERYAEYLQTGYIAFERFDSNLLDAGTHPVAVGVNSAT